MQPMINLQTHNDHELLLPVKMRCIRLVNFLRRSHMLGSLNKPLSLVVYRFHLRIKESGQFCLRSLSKRRGRWGYRNVMPDLTRSLQKRRLIWRLILSSGWQRVKVQRKPSMEMRWLPVHLILRMVAMQWALWFSLIEMQMVFLKWSRHPVKVMTMSQSHLTLATDSMVVMNMFRCGIIKVLIWAISISMMQLPMGLLANKTFWISGDLTGFSRQEWGISSRSAMLKGKSALHVTLRCINWKKKTFRILIRPSFSKWRRLDLYRYMWTSWKPVQPMCRRMQRMQN